MLKQLGESIFKFYCHPDFQEDILGDLEEYYEINKDEKGTRYANRKFLFDALLLFRFSLLKDNWFTQKIIRTTMVKNNFKMAYRSMMRHKFYSFLNLFGLSISMAACVFIAIYVKDELSYDKHIQEHERIYRIAAHIKYADNLFDIPAAPDPMAKSLKADFPEIMEAGRTNGNFTQLMKVEEKYFRQEGITFADQEWFNIFNLPLVRGDRAHLLDEPNTVVLEESVAKKYFGDDDPMGKVINLNGSVDLKVTGILADIPHNTHFSYQVFVSMLNNPSATQNQWLSNNFITYLKLNAGNDEAALQTKFDDFIVKYVGPFAKQMMNIDLDEALASGGLELKYYLQPLASIHLHSNLDFELGETGTIDYVYMFSIIGFFILMVACINFMNMSTARAAVRAKEVGVRKVLGSARKQLMNQFLTESILNAFMAFVIAIGLVYLILPAFNQLTDKQLTDPVFATGGLWPYLLLAALVVGFLAGIYPAFVLSNYKPIKVIKGELAQGKGSKWMRNSLVVFQFTTSIFLIIASGVIYSQLNFLQTKELGFNKDQILIISETQLLGEQIEAFKTELQRNAVIEQASISNYIPATNINNDFPLLREDATTPDDGVSTQNWNVDFDYLNTYDIELVAGRFFSKEYPSDSFAIVLNETAVRRFGYEADPIGKKVKTLGGLVGNTSEQYTIIGVMKDFQFKSMMTEVQPHALYLRPSNGAISVKFSKESAAEVVKVVTDSWDKFSGGLPLDYQFLDQIFADNFKDQNKVKTIFSVFAMLAITIACLGLFGLAAFVTEQRKKEIGIRKVLGASSITLLNLLFNSFNKLIIIAALLAIPLAWWYTEGWLNNYPVRIGLNPMTFILGVLAVLVVAWITVGYQSFKATKRNPVDNLRYE